MSNLSYKLNFLVIPMPHLVTSAGQAWWPGPGCSWMHRHEARVWYSVTLVLPFETVLDRCRNPERMRFAVDVMDARIGRGVLTTETRHVSASAAGQAAAEQQRKVPEYVKPSTTAPHNRSIFVVTHNRCHQETRNSTMVRTKPGRSHRSQEGMRLCGHRLFRAADEVASS